tara:strand:+ start:894 stop:1049 length:156 start_codon:yes stop_codon:yes gene_type:complete
MISIEINKGPLLSFLLRISNDSTLPNFTNNIAEIRGNTIVNVKTIIYRAFE